MQPSTLIEKLKPHAQAAAAQAYAPHSKLRFGVAVLGSHGQIHTGCNVENSSFSLTQCAERNALCGAVCQGESPGEIGHLVLFSPGSEALTPCGACRQVISELLAPDSIIISTCEGDSIKTWHPAELLPDAFTLAE